MVLGHEAGIPLTPRYSWFAMTPRQRTVMVRPRPAHVLRADLGVVGQRVHGRAVLVAGHDAGAGGRRVAEDPQMPLLDPAV
eukprot:CAMPEP_0170585330 /NCGR_PEP_ID=MMETSP0224-20130122/9154_1 /TAXON_ID=285029 /ORGANISM="Togula jolla, Strain CCCM 725" /LENGTH=80 /DNA_ID=CAMNT_0010908803 /DNA_START=266 /DNA_END=508 /DNA_ORIENTATION=-